MCARATSANGRLLSGPSTRSAVEGGATVHPGEHAGAVELVQVAPDRGGADVQGGGQVGDRHGAVGTDPGHDLGVALHLHAGHATNRAQNQPRGDGSVRPSELQASISAHPRLARGAHRVHHGEMPNTFDPLAPVRRAGDPEVDVFVQGMVFLDIVFTGLHELPRPGTEVWADGMGSCPGGIANLAVAVVAARPAHLAGGGLR